MRLKLVSLAGLLAAVLLAAGPAVAHAATGSAPALAQAADAGDAQAVRALIKAGADVNGRQPDGSTALHFAANRGSLPVVEALLAAGADAKAANRYGVTPLALASATANVAVVERLLTAGADPKTPGIGGAPVLMTAARAGAADVIRLLIRRGADVNAVEPTRSQTALMWAAAEGNVDAIKALVEGGANVSARSSEVDFKKADVSMRSSAAPAGDTTIRFTPLFFAIRAGHQPAVKALLDAGVDPNEKLPDGVNGVIVAIINAHFELAAYLLDQGANPNAAEGGWTALHQVARSRSLTVGQVPHPVPTGGMSSMDLAKKLVAMGANVNARMTRDGMRADGYRTQLNRIGATPYLLAAKGVDHELMRLLLANGADPMLTNDHGMRPLGVAAGVALHATGEDSGTHENALEAVKVAYEVDQDVNYVDKRGHTALMGAARRGALQVVRFLVERGAKLDATIKRENFLGQAYGTKGLAWTPLTIALGFGKDGVPLFLGSERAFDVAAYLYTEMKKRGLSFEHEHAESLAMISKMAEGNLTAAK
ncbi:MAG: ankyrin repeat domain-containing protein [Alphaproteobacteria bacterium]